ncbi:MAG: NAD(P)/FAD-dependent oxidoreductase [Promethearchaeota archaeon]|nr:MAG: NAD(P)/FAD-dependent oxidoreductase [Candidatus Lokiarchaeota archaeon]
MIKYDYIIIGSGLGGLGAGGVLAKAGKRVLIIEKNAIPGGRCSSYKKKGFTIDYGTHIITRSEYGPIGDIINILGIEDQLKFYHLTRMPSYLLGNGQAYGPFGLDINQKNTLSMPVKMDNFKGIGLTKADFENIFAKMSKLVQNISLPKTEELNHVPFQEYIESIELGQGIKQMLYFLYMSGLCIMPHEGSAGEFLRTLLCVMGSSIKSVWMDHDGLSFGYPFGGCISIPHAICNGIEKYNVDILYKNTVEKIIIKNDKSIGVRTSNDKIYEGNKIISNVGPKETILQLCGKEFFNREYINYIKNIKPSIRSFVLKIALDKEITKEPFQFLLTSEMQDTLKITIENKIPDIPVGIFIPATSIMDPSLAPKGKQILLPGTIYAPYKDKGMDEEKLKEKVLSCMELVFPHFQNHIEWIDVFTPKMAMKLWNNVDGAINRVGQTIDQVGDKGIDFYTPIENLYLVGCGIGKGLSGVGTEFALQSGMTLANNLLKMK